MTVFLKRDVAVTFYSAQQNKLHVYCTDEISESDISNIPLWAGLNVFLFIGNLGKITLKIN